jgi:hypothetical protein
MREGSDTQPALRFKHLITVQRVKNYFFLAAAEAVTEFGQYFTEAK